MPTTKPTKTLRPKRPTKKPIRAVMLEYIGESGDWQWYEIIFDMTPYEAVEYFYNSNNYDEDKADNELKGIDTNNSHPTTDEARAYYITF